MVDYFRLQVVDGSHHTIGHGWVKFAVRLLDNKGASLWLRCMCRCYEHIRRMSLLSSANIPMARGSASYHTRYKGQNEGGNVYD